MRVVCAGLATRDSIFAVPEHPPADGRVVATALVVAGGGPAATAAVALARLGIETAFVGVVGDDEAGAFVREGLEREGIDVSGIIVDGSRTPQSAILVGPNGERAIVHRPGDAEFPTAEIDADWVHVDHASYGRVRTNGRLSLDAGNPIDNLDLSGVALYGPTEERLRADFGDAEHAIAQGAEMVVVTRGADGSVATTRDGVLDAPGIPCDPISTLGAGDVFHGALLAFLARGAPLEEALRAANTAASLSCRALDGRSAIPDLDELQRSMT
jgi:sugar/nucleoside kinase (ribokinase family)